MKQLFILFLVLIFASCIKPKIYNVYNTICYRNYGGTKDTINIIAKEIPALHNDGSVRADEKVFYTNCMAISILFVDTTSIQR